MQVQFSISCSDSTLQTTKLRILDTGNVSKRDEANETAWHMQWTCTGIHHCEYAHKDVLKTCSAYDSPRVEAINDLRKSVHNQVSTDISVLLRMSTEARYHAIRDAWRRQPCLNPETGANDCPETALGVYTATERKVQ